MVEDRTTSEHSEKHREEALACWVRFERDGACVSVDDVLAGTGMTGLQVRRNRFTVLTEETSIPDDDDGDDGGGEADAMGHR